MRYTDTVMDHFMNPRHAGRLLDADGIGILGSPECGDQLRVWIKVRSGKLTEVRHQVFGCPAAIAACSMMAQLATGLTIEDAVNLTDAAVAEALGGLPPEKMHCSNLAATALHQAVRSYRDGQDAADALHLTVLVNNRMPKPLQAEHGLSVWIEYAGKHILFDTGRTDAVVKNAERLNIDLSKTDAIVLSHGHYDHTGGLPAVLAVAPEATIYLHPSAPKVRYSCRDGQPPKDISMPPAACERIADKMGRGQVMYTAEAEPVCPHVIVSGFIPRQTDYEDTGGPFYLDPQAHTSDQLEDDQALLITTPRGLVVIVGCCHAGLVNTLDRAAELTGRSAAAVLGGTHLRAASPERIEKTFEALERSAVRVIAPCHCTGDGPIEQFKTRFPSAFSDVGTSVRLTL